MRYFLDTEFNGFCGALLSVALVPEDGGEEFYLTLECRDPIEPWVERHVIPFLDMVPDAMRAERQPREAAADALAHYLAGDPRPEILADWPEDIAQFCNLLMPGPGLIVPVPSMTFRLIRLPGFSVARNSAVPHNALHDARALRDHLQQLLD